MGSTEAASMFAGCPRDPRRSLTAFADGSQHSGGDPYDSHWANIVRATHARGEWLTAGEAGPSSRATRCWFDWFQELCIKKESGWRGIRTPGIPGMLRFSKPVP